MVAATPENITSKRAELTEKISLSKINGSTLTLLQEHKELTSEETDFSLIACDSQIDQTSDSKISIHKEVEPIKIIKDYQFFQEGFEGKHFLMVL